MAVSASERRHRPKLQLSEYNHSESPGLLPVLPISVVPIAHEFRRRVNVRL